jgi:hypothetical protein
MDEQQNEPDQGKAEGAQAEQGEGQQPKQAGDDDSSSFWDTEQHSDAPGPFGTGEEQTVEEAAGNPLAEEDSEDE